MKKYTESQKIEVCNKYSEGFTIEEVSKATGIPKTTVGRILDEKGIQKRSKACHRQVHKFSEDKEKEIIRLYVEENKNTNEIAQLLGTYNTSVRRVLLRNNVKIRARGVARRFVQLEDIKSKEGTDDFDYFLGLLATDGCVTKNNIVLDFAEQNKELLNYWNEFLGNKCNINVSIHKVYKTPQYRIAFSNPEIKEFLSTYGIVERKTYDLHLKYINWNVLRGIIDGDGCILKTNEGRTISIGITSGCKNFLEQIQQFYSDNGIKSYLRESNRNINPTYDLYVHKSEDVLKIYENLYKNAHFFLKRKEEKFGSLLEKFNKCKLVNSGKEMCNSNPEPSLCIEEGVETLNELPKD